MRHMEDRTARGFIDPARFHSNIAILHQINPPDPMRAAQFIEAGQQRRRAHLLAVDSHRITRLVVNLDFERLVRRLFRRHRHLENFIRRGLPGIFKNTALVTHVKQVQIHTVRLRLRRRHGNAVPIGILDQFAPRPHCPFTPRGDDRKIRRQRRVGQLEPHLVVSLSGGAMRHRLGAFFERDLSLTPRNEGPRDRGPEQITAFVYGVAA